MDEPEYRRLIIQLGEAFSTIEGQRTTVACQQDIIAGMRRQIAGLRDDARKWYRPSGAFEFLPTVEDVVRRRKAMAKTAESMLSALKAVHAYCEMRAEIGHPLPDELASLVFCAIVNASTS